MFNFNPKMSIRKYPIPSSWYNFSVLMFQIFTRISLLKIKTLRLDIFVKNQPSTWLINNKLTCFVALYDEFKYEKFWELFFFLF